VHNLPRFKFLRLLIGFPVIFAGISLPLIGAWPWFLYFLGLMIALIGGYILTRSFDYSLSGIGFVIIGLPLLLYSMRQTSYQFLSAIGGDPTTIIIIRFGVCLTALIIVFASFHDD
jgi:hypothetical protein